MLGTYGKYLFKIILNNACDNLSSFHNMQRHTQTHNMQDQHKHINMDIRKHEHLHYTLMASAYSM